MSVPLLLVLTSLHSLLFYIFMKFHRSLHMTNDLPFFAVSAVSAATTTTIPRITSSITTIFTLQLLLSFVYSSNSLNTIVSTTTKTSRVAIDSCAIRRNIPIRKQFLLSSLLSSRRTQTQIMTTSTSTTTSTLSDIGGDGGDGGDTYSSNRWIANDPKQAIIAKHTLEIWPLDENNAKLLNEVHPYQYTQSTSKIHPIYDLVAIGSGAAGLVSAKQSARRGAKSALISEKLAGGDCLNVGCVPSKALLHAAKTINTIRDGQSKYFYPSESTTSSTHATRTTPTTNISTDSSSSNDNGNNSNNGNNINVNGNGGDANFASIMDWMKQLRSAASPAYTLSGSSSSSSSGRNNANANSNAIGNSRNNNGKGGDVNFPSIMERMRQLRSKISPADGHSATVGTGAHVFQGRGIFTGPDTIQVVTICEDPDDSTKHITIMPEIKFRKAVIATGGRPMVPTDIPGLLQAPYTTNESIFNLQTLPNRMVILGSGVVALEMAYCFATFGTDVTIIQRKRTLFESKDGDIEAANILQTSLERLGVTFLSETTVEQVTTIRRIGNDNTWSTVKKANDAPIANTINNSEHPLMQITVVTATKEGTTTLECECLLVALGRMPNVERLGLTEAGVNYQIGDGIIINDYAQSVSNPNVYAAGDCVGGGIPRLTHVAGEMAKLIIQNSLFNDTWKLSSLIVPSVMYTSPEYATVGIYSEAMAKRMGTPVDVYRTNMEHNDRAILEDNNIGFCSILCKKDTDTIVGCTIVAERAGEMINEVTLAMKNNIGLYNIGRNIHPYPSTGEAVMGCGVTYINAKAKRFSV